MSAFSLKCILHLKSIAPYTFPFHISSFRFDNSMALTQVEYVVPKFFMWYFVRRILF